MKSIREKFSKIDALLIINISLLLLLLLLISLSPRHLKKDIQQVDYRQQANISFLFQDDYKLYSFSSAEYLTESDRLTVDAGDVRPFQLISNYPTKEQMTICLEYDSRFIDRAFFIDYFDYFNKSIRVNAPEWMNIAEPHNYIACFIPKIE